jgi:hypothetical protein
MRELLAMGAVVLLVTGLLVYVARAVMRQLEAAWARVDELTNTIIALRRDHHFEPPTKAGTVIQPPDPEIAARRRLAKEFVDNYVRDAVLAGIPEHEARAEAMALREQLDTQQPSSL